MSAILEQDFQKKKLNLKTWKTILSYASNGKKYITLAASFGILTGILDLLTSFIGMWAIDSYIVPKMLDGFPLFAIGIVGIQFFFALFTLVFVVASGKLEAMLSTDVRKDAFTKLQTLSFSYFDKTSVGYLLTRLTNDVTRTTETVSWIFIDLGWGTTSILAGIIGVFIVNPKLALLVVLALPLLVLVSVFFQKRILANQRETRRINSMITSSFNEGIMGAKTTKTLVREEMNNRELFSLTENMRKASMRAVSMSALYMPTASMIISIVVALVFLQGGQDVLKGLVTIGQLNFFMQIGNMMFEPIRHFARLFAELQSSQAAAERILDVLNAKSDIVDSESVVSRYGDLFHAKRENWEPIEGTVEFKNVSFYYIDGEPVLKNFNLKVEAGQNIALVGETGSGKSTIVNLICRFYEPQQGEILIDGKDIRDRSQLWLQSNLGYVLQSPQLFSGSIAENIRYGKLTATDDEVRQAAEMVGAHAFIMGLEKGYETEVGEGGGLISTGQKQLISFARAIIADPKIFVLDEATSSIDTESEMKIQKASETLLKNRTSFIIAHRLSTVRGADRILVIENGEVIEQGSHHELMAKRGYYYELYTNQFQRDREEESLKALQK